MGKAASDSIQPDCVNCFRTQATLVHVCHPYPIAFEDHEQKGWVCSPSILMKTTVVWLRPLSQWWLDYLFNQRAASVRWAHRPPKAPVAPWEALTWAPEHACVCVPKGSWVGHLKLRVVYTGYMFQW